MEMMMIIHGCNTIEMNLLTDKQQLEDIRHTIQDQVQEHLRLYK